MTTAIVIGEAIGIGSALVGMVIGTVTYQLWKERKWRREMRKWRRGSDV